ncbi:hypothetical protein WJX77_007507 [Trebouxia sp. C0004]
MLISFSLMFDATSLQIASLEHIFQQAFGAEPSTRYQLWKAPTSFLQQQLDCKPWQQQATFKTVSRGSPPPAAVQALAHNSCWAARLLH